MSREYIISSVLSRSSRTLEWPVLEPHVNFLGHSKNLKWQMDLCYSSVLQSVLFGKQMKIHPWGVKAGWPKRSEEKRSPQLNFGSSFMCFFLLALSLTLCKLGYPGGLLVLPEGLTLVLGPSFVLFSWGFSLFCLFSHFGLIFPILTT